METILFLGHTEESGELTKGSLEALGAAVALSESLSDAALHVGLVGKQLDAAANSIAGCGAEKFLGVEGADYSIPRYGSDAAAAEALCKEVGATVVVAVGSSRWSRTLGGVAQRLNGRLDSHAATLNVEDNILTVGRWFYRQRMEGKVQRSKRPWFILVDPGSSPAYTSTSGSAAVQKLSISLSEELKRTSVEGLQEPAADEQTIRPDAELLFVTGAGWTKKQADGQTHVPQASELILDFLNKTKSSLGSSKSLVDMDSQGEGVLPFLTHLNQIGQTGATPRHAKGLATCCHGEEPHVVGWRFINDRRAVNTDPNCGWAQGKADVLYVADAFEVMEEVNKLLAS